MGLAGVGGGDEAGGGTVPAAGCWAPGTWLRMESRSISRVWTVRRRSTRVLRAVSTSLLLWVISMVLSVIWGGQGCGLGVSTWAWLTVATPARGGGVEKWKHPRKKQP